LIDCGASSLIAMKRWGVDPSGIDVILLTHLHGDHFGGLPFFLLEAQLISKRTTSLVVAGPPGLEPRIREAMEVLFPGSSRVPQRFAMEFVELEEGGTTPIRPLAVAPYRVVHASGAPPYALRVSCSGKAITYSGDTEWTDALIEASEGADLFICAAYFFSKKIEYHLDDETLMTHRARLGCRRLLLTHLSADVLARLQRLEIEAAEDGQRIVL
jgi:ribonuclease BN (tRNA processing enzyme)